MEKIPYQANLKYLMWTVNSFRIRKLPSPITSVNMLLVLGETYNLNIL